MPLMLTAATSTPCIIPAVAEALGFLLVIPGAVLLFALALFLIFGSSGRLFGMVDAVVWAFGNAVRAIVVGVILLSAAAGGVLLLVADTIAANCLE